MRDKRSLKYTKVFRCAAYVLKIDFYTKFESGPSEGVYLQTPEHGVQEVLIADDSEIRRIVRSQHVTFDATTLLEVPYLTNYMDGESALDL